MEPKDQTKQESNKWKRRSGQSRTIKDSGYPSSTYDSQISEESPRVRRSRSYGRDSYTENSGGNTLNKILSVAGIVAGGALLFKATKGEWPFSKKPINIDLHTQQTIQRSPEDLYAYWRKLENLPDFMSHIKEIWEIDEKRSRWTAKIPGGIGTIEWDAEIIQDRENEFISWRSVGDSDIQNSGEVRFRNAGNGRATIVETTISYRPPAGKMGKLTAQLLNPAFEKIVKNDLKQFKKHMEEGGDEKFRNELSDNLY